MLTGPAALGAPGMAAFGRDGTVPLTVRLPGVPRQVRARWSRLPDLLPLLVQAPPRPPHLLVSATRDGVAALRDGEAAELFPGGDYLSGDRDVPGPRWSDAPGYAGPGLAEIGLTEGELRERLVTGIMRFAVPGA